MDKMSSYYVKQKIHVNATRKIWENEIILIGLK